MKQVLLLGTAVAIAGIGGSAGAQAPGSEFAPGATECAGSPDDFGPCLHALAGQSSEIARRLANVEAGSPTEADLKADQKRTNLAVAAFTDLSGRVAKITELEAARKEAMALSVGAAEKIAKYQALRIQEFDDATKAVKDSREIVQAGAYAYANDAITSYRGRAHYAAAAASMRRAQDDEDRLDNLACAWMLDKPEVTYDVGDCKKAAIARSSLAIPGGDIKVPGSVLDPRGFSALVNASDSGGGVRLTFATEQKVRGRLYAEPDPDKKLPRPWSWSASAGVKAGDGTLFTRNDDIPNSDQIDSKAALTGSLTLNFFSRETYADWQDRWSRETKSLKDACSADQKLAKPIFLSSCIGASLTDWVYAVDAKGELLHKAHAEVADSLYYGSGNNMHLFGFGISAELARSSHSYLLPGDFQTLFDPRVGFDDAFKDAALRRSSDWVASISPYAYVRLTKAASKVGLSFIPSYTIASSLGYSSTYEKPLFCPPITSGVPFTTAGCQRYFGKAPTFAEVQTVAGELRSTFPFFGGLDLIFSPKLSWNDRDRRDFQPWLLSAPVLVFTDEQKTSAVGVKVDWGFGKTDMAGADADDDVVVKLILQKTFSLTGN